MPKYFIFDDNEVEELQEKDLKVGLAIYEKIYFNAEKTEYIEKIIVDIKGNKVITKERDGKCYGYYFHKNHCNWFYVRPKEVQLSLL